MPACSSCTTVACSPSAHSCKPSKQLTPFQQTLKTSLQCTNQPTEEISINSSCSAKLHSSMCWPPVTTSAHLLPPPAQPHTCITQPPNPALLSTGLSPAACLPASQFRCNTGLLRLLLRLPVPLQPSWHTPCSLHAAHHCHHRPRRGPGVLHAHRGAHAAQQRR